MVLEGLVRITGTPVKTVRETQRVCAGENSRVLKWICERVEGTAKSQKTSIGNLPTPDSLDLSGLGISSENVNALTSVDANGWKSEADDIAAYYAKFDGRLPEGLKEQLMALKQRVGA